MKNLYKGILPAVLVAMTMASCEEFEAPSDIESKAGDFVQGSNEIIAVETDVEDLASLAFNSQVSVADAQASSNADVKEAGDVATSFLDIMEETIHYGRIASNAMVTTEAIEATNVGDAEVRVYDYTISQLSDGAISAEYVTYQIALTDTSYIHHIFAGASENPTDLVLKAVVPIDGATVAVETNFGAQFDFTYSHDNASNSTTYSKSGDTQILEYKTNSDGSFTYDQKNVAGELISSLTWSDAGYGVKDGSFFHPEWSVLSLQQSLDDCATIAGNANATQSNKMYEGYINRVGLMNRLYTFNPDTVSISSKVSGDFSVIEFAYATIDGSVQYEFYFDDNTLYRDIYLDGTLKFSAEESKSDGSYKIITDPGVPTTDEFWNHKLTLEYALNGDVNEYIVTIPHNNAKGWTDQATARYYSFKYKADLSGEFLDQHATQADWEAGTPWGNAYWHDSDFTANGNTGNLAYKALWAWGATPTNETW